MTRELLGAVVIGVQCGNVIAAGMAIIPIFEALDVTFVVVTAITIAVATIVVIAIAVVVTGIIVVVIAITTIAIAIAAAAFPGLQWWLCHLVV